MQGDDCLVCGIVEGKIPSKKIYEDDEILAVLDVNGALPGHCFILPKEHYPIMEQVPDFIISKLFFMANKISSALFETLAAQGTNIFVANGVAAGQTVAHFTVNVVPRKEGDGINLQWQPKQLDEEEMSTVELRLKEETKNIGYFDKGKPGAPKKETKKEAETIEGEENYLIKALRRIP